jgi:hypothetical protein
VGDVRPAAPPKGMVDAFNEMLYGPPNTMERRRAKHMLRLRYMRKLIVEVAIIVGVLITVGVYMYVSVLLLERLG